MRFYLIFGFLGFRVVNKRTMNLFKSKVVKISQFPILSAWIEKYKLALSKSDSSWDNSYCVRLVIVSLAVKQVSCSPSSVKITFSVEYITVSAAISCCALL